MLSANGASVVLPTLGKGRLLWLHIFHRVRLQMRLRWLGTPSDTHLKSHWERESLLSGPKMWIRQQGFILQT